MKMRKVKPMPTIAPAKSKAKRTYKLQGFDSVDQFLAACREHDFIAQRHKYAYKGTRYHIITCRVKNPANINEKTGEPIIVTAWHLLDADETCQITEGSVLGIDLGLIYTQIDEFLDQAS